MKFLCSLGLHCWETIQSSEFRAEQYTLFDKEHYDLRIGNILTQECKGCGKERQTVLRFTQSEIVLHMLREVGEDLKRNNEKLKDNNRRLKEIYHKLKSTNSDPNEKLRKSVERMNEAVRRLKDENGPNSPLEDR